MPRHWASARVRWMRTGGLISRSPATSRVGHGALTSCGEIRVGQLPALSKPWKIRCQAVMVGETSHVVVPHAATVAYAMQKDDRWRSGCSRLAYVERTGPGPFAGSKRIGSPLMAPSRTVPTGTGEMG